MGLGVLGGSQSPWGGPLDLGVPGVLGWSWGGVSVGLRVLGGSQGVWGALWIWGSLGRSGGGAWGPRGVLGGSLWI